MFDKFDICEAAYCVLVNYRGHSRRVNAIEGRLDALQFKASDSVARDLEDGLSENGREVYDRMVANFGCA